MKSKILFVYVTCANKAEAEHIGRSSVEKSLAACANIFPDITSIYSWKGELKHEVECVSILKTDSEHFEDLKKHILEVHSYECPCITAFSAEQGHQAYFDWIQNQLSKK